MDRKARRRVSVSSLLRYLYLILSNFIKLIRCPPLCGAVAAGADYIAKPGDTVAARVKTIEAEEQWILAEVEGYLLMIVLNAFQLHCSLSPTFQDCLKQNYLVKILIFNTDYTIYELLDIN